MFCTICCGDGADSCADAPGENMEATPSRPTMAVRERKRTKRDMGAPGKCWKGSADKWFQPPEDPDFGFEGGADPLPPLGPPLTRNLPIRSSSCMDDCVSNSSSPSFRYSGEPPGCRATYWSPNKPLVNIAAAVSSGISSYLSSMLSVTSASILPRSSWMDCTEPTRTPAIFTGARSFSWPMLEKRAFNV